MKLKDTLKRRTLTLERRLASFKATRVRDLEAATELAYLAVVLDDISRYQQALGCLLSVSFEGDFNKWSPVERGKALFAWVGRGSPHGDEPARTRRELLAAGVSERRMKGALIRGPAGRLAGLKRARESGTRRDQFDALLLLFQELVFLWCAGAGLNEGPPLDKWISTCVDEFKVALNEE